MSGGARFTPTATSSWPVRRVSCRRTADRRHEENLLAQAEALAVVARDHAALGRALLEARKAGSSLTDAVERALGWEGLAASVEVAESATGGGTEGDGIEEVISRHTILRRAATILFETFRVSCSCCHHAHVPRDGVARLPS